MKQDNLFINKLIKGDSDAFRKLYREKYPVLCVYANKYIGDKGLCSDLVQDIFTKIWDSPQIIKPNKSLDSFLFVCVKNSCYSYLKKTRKNNLIGMELSFDIEQENNSADFIKLNLYDKLYGFIKDLPDRSKQIMIMALGGESNSYIMQELGISINTVRTVKQRVYSKIRESVELTTDDDVDFILFYLFRSVGVYN
ncbi:MAG: sigma-70 family RNA polymerase sigma factor [Marinifilaceae bacterium]|jgi:RNA polymerase sigma-70 factor (ECF subfamily)|nr:sigma-70 family RNA polymerase sigma factor [Marinifilaceae bacterium]